MTKNGRFAMAVHVLAVLAYKNGDPVSSEFLAVSVNTNPVIIRRLLRVLQEAHLVETRKGPRAGSRLTRSPARITLDEVYLAVCGPRLFATSRHRPNGHCPVGQGIRAALKPVFLSAQEGLQRALAKTTLARLLETIQASAKTTR